MDDWIVRHHEAWRSKPGLRQYYEREIFDRLTGAIGDVMPLLEVGAGPGFLGEHLNRLGRPVTAIDIDPGAASNVTCDIHALPFAERTFAGALGVDCLHHFGRPAIALNEVARVLVPGGRLALVEPWTGLLGYLFYRFVHHEDCFWPNEPLEDAFPAGKSAMDGNAMIPKVVLHESTEAFAAAVPGLRVVMIEPFAGLSYLLTGGFQKWGFPAGVVLALTKLESCIPPSLMRLAGLRALFVLEKVS